MNRNASPADQDQPPAVQPNESAGAPRRGATKFLYGTGDQPLEGYTIKRGVGRGGFGEVYFATSDAGKEVALKLIRRNLDIELRGVRQCLNLKHHNLVSLYDIRSDAADDEWVVMEYVDGESLEDILERHPKGLPVEQAVEWLRGIVAGVGYLHSSGIVHRDLKPGNLFLERSGAAPGSALSGVVKIGDYGLSKFISASKRSGQTESVGTVHYMAPEIAGGRYGREIDLYAIGIIFYEMLTGHVPFEGESVGEVLMKHLTAEPDLSKVDEPYRTIVARTLTKDPEARLESVEEMVAMLPGATTPAAGSPAAGSPASGSDDSIVLEMDLPEVEGGVWKPVSTPPHTAQSERDREPLWQGMVDLTDSARRRWYDWNVSPLIKGILLFGFCWFAIISSWAWLGMLVGIAPIYMVYYIFWSMFVEDSSKNKPNQIGPNGRGVGAETIAYRHKPSRQREPRLGWRDAAQREVRNMPWRERARDLVGSMLFAAVIVIGCAVIIGPLLANGTGTDPMALGTWTAVVATLGSWAVLFVNRMTEGFVEDRAPMRGFQLMLGLILGVVAFGLASIMGVSLPNVADISPGPKEYLLNEAFDIDIYPGVSSRSTQIQVPLVASAGYFGILMLLCRWWRLAECTRNRRIGFWSVIGCMIWAYLISLIWWYPQPMALALAATIALATQASSRWVPPSRRIELARSI